MPSESSIYIHLPFCKSKCYYCNFYSETNNIITHADYIDLLIKEINIRKISLDGTLVKSIYFGGGTPSLFEPKLIEKFLSFINKTFIISNNAEVTIEVNPDDITANYVESLANYTCINRFSVGVQSFNNNELMLINRRHTSEKAVEAIEIILKKFNNISIDLIYGLPSQNLESLNYNIDTALQFHPKHISAYSLTVEQNTPLDIMLKQKNINIPDEDSEVDFYLLLLEKLKKKGYEHYEVSNYSLPGYQSQHNSSYWNRSIYLGLGAGAHSYDGRKRRWNISSIPSYKMGIESQKKYFEEEQISSIDAYNEYIMLGFRTKKGIDLDFISREFGKDLCEKTYQTLQGLPSNHLFINELNYSLNDLGMLFADKYACDFFIY